MPETPQSAELQESAGRIVRKALGSKAAVESAFPWGGGARNTCYGVCTRNPTGKFFLKIEKGEELPRTRWGQIERGWKGRDDPEYLKMQRLVEAAIQPLPFHDIAGTCGRDENCACLSCWIRKVQEERQRRVAAAR